MIIVDTLEFGFFFGVYIIYYKNSLRLNKIEEGFGRVEQSANESRAKHGSHSIRVTRNSAL